MTDIESRYEPLRGQQRPPTPSLDRGRFQSLGSPLFKPRRDSVSSPYADQTPKDESARQRITITEPSSSETLPGTDDADTVDELPAKYIGPEMRRASFTLKRRKTPMPETQQLRQGLRWWLPEVGWVLVSAVCVLGEILSFPAFQNQHQDRVRNRNS